MSLKKVWLMKTNQELVLPETIASPRDLMQLLLDVKLYANWYAHESIHQRVVQKKGEAAPTISPSAQNVISDWDALTPVSTKGFTELIATLESYANHAEVMTITLAAPVTQTVKTSLVAWCRKNVSAHIFVSFRYNSTILGGMVVRHGSRIFDWSFKRQIIAASENFVEVLRRV
jgi:hypothetical protein